MLLDYMNPKDWNRPLISLITVILYAGESNRNLCSTLHNITSIHRSLPLCRAGPEKIVIQAGSQD